MTTIVECDEESCIFNIMNMCSLANIKIDVDGHCDSKEQT